jgi:hypothetical protein
MIFEFFWISVKYFGIIMIIREVMRLGERWGGDLGELVRGVRKR